MPLALSQFDPLPMNRDFTPSSNYAVNEAKNSALLADAARKKEATQRLSGRMPDVQKAIQNHDIMNQGVQDLMEVNPELYKTMANAVKAQDEVAKSRAEKTANFMAGVVPYVLGAKERGVPEAQAWEDYKGFGLQGGVPLGQFENMPYSENALALLKSSVYGIKGVLEGGATIKQESGALVTRTPLGDVKDVKVLPQESADRPIPLRTYESGNKKITEEYVGGKWRVKATADISKPEKPKAAPEPKLVTTYDDQGNAQFETVMPGQMPKGKPQAKTASVGQPSVEENKDAGFYSRMAQMSPLLDQYESSGSSTLATNMAGTVPLIGSYLQRKAMTPDQQNYMTSAMAWIRAKLRKESGAVIGEKEAKDEYETYFPMPGDDKSRIELKRELRRTAEQEMRISAGRAAPKADKVVSDALAERDQSKQKQSDLIRIKSTAEYNALKSGTVFIDPKGTKRVKP